MDNRDALILDYLDPGFSAALLAEFDNLLRSDPAACDRLARAALLEALLEQHFADEQLIEQGAAASMERTDSFLDRLRDDEAESESASRQGKRRVRWGRLACAAAVSAALVGAIVHFGNRPSRLGESQILAGRVLVDGVVATRVPAGARIQVLGPESARLQLADGAQADLEPATTAIFDAAADGTQLELESGGGTFRVVGSGAALCVQTEGGSVLARDTDFSVVLRDSAEPGSKESGVPMAGTASGNLLMALTVAVVAGQVQVESADQKATITLKAGESREIAFEKKPIISGTVVAVSDDGRQLTLAGSRPKPGAEPKRILIEINDQTTLVYFGVTRKGGQPTVGYAAVAWLDKHESRQATRIEFGSKEPAWSGTVVAVSDDGRQITLDVWRKQAEPLRKTVVIDDETRLSYSGIDSPSGERPTIGYQAQVWQGAGREAANEIRFVSKSGAKSPAVAKPPATKPAKQPEPPQPERKQPEPKQPKMQPAKPAPEAGKKTKPSSSSSIPRRVSVRDFAPISAAIDRIADEALSKAQIPASPPIGAAEFLRRVSLDLTGRIPTLDPTRAFLDRSDPAKRREMVDSLLFSPAFAEHFARWWGRLIAPPDYTSTKTGVDHFTPWLAEQLAGNRPWNEIVGELLNGDSSPRWAFYQAHSAEGAPKPNLLAAATGRLFLGVQIGCAECHQHPFAAWTQDDFWGLAAFYNRVHRRSKSDFTLTEEPEGSERRWSEASIAVPDGSGKAAGKVVPARFLGGSLPSSQSEPLRPQLVAWLTAHDNPYFARATVNRLWAHFFGRGLVHPVDDQRPGNAPSHPELLALLAEEFVASGYDLQHLARSICLSQTYQRSALPLAANEHDTKWLSHHIVREMTPDMLYDSLQTVLGTSLTPSPASGGKKFGGKPALVSLGSRESFVRSFGRLANDSPADQFSYGIPQVLRLLNAQELNAGTRLLTELVAYEPDARKRIETLYLVVLARPPEDGEVQRMLELIGGQLDAAEAYAGPLWVLLNSSEFIVNH